MARGKSISSSIPDSSANQDRASTCLPLIDPRLINWDILPDSTLERLGKRIDNLRAARGHLRPDDLLTPVKVARLVHVHHSVVYDALLAGTLVGVRRTRSNGKPYWQIVRTEAMAWWHKANRT